MQLPKINKAVATAVVVVFLFTLIAQAQDRRQAQPAFPIGAGEKMLIIPGAAGDGFGSTISYRAASSGNSATLAYRVLLPVGTTIKRFVFEAADTNATGGVILTVKLVRISNTDGTTQVILRSTDTSGITSSGITDFQQIVTNPLSHAMLQGWTYWVHVTPSGTQGANELAIGVMKIIYEP